MPRRKNPSTPPTSGINYQTILDDRARGMQKQRYTCACGGRVIPAETSPLSEKFWCQKCHDVLVLLIRQKTSEPPRQYATDHYTL